MPGYGRQDCLLQAFDSTQHEVNWRRDSDLARLRGKPVSLRLYLQSVDLYGFHIQ